MDTDTVPPWHLRGNWEPVLDEITGTDLRIEGNIPRELDGLYVHTGPNPVNGTSPHWFYGDGMVHGIRLRDGRADWYRNRFVETEPVRRHRGERVKLPELAKGTGNTHVIAHNGSLMALEEHPAVAIAAVVSVKDPVYSEVGAAYVVCEPGASAGPEELRAWCKERLAGYKVPKTFETRDDLPLLPIGKVDKQALRRSHPAGG